MFAHFKFDDGSNPYISFTNKAFYWMLKHYDAIQIGETSFRVIGRKTPVKGYRENQDFIRTIAIEWQNNSSDYNYSYMDFAKWSDFFREYGKRYGLLKEFRENGIC